MPARTGKAKARRKFARDVQRSYNQHGDSWVYRFQPPDIMSVLSGDINNFNEAKLT